MPTAQIDSNGTQIYYEDSGAPPSQTPYTTVVIINGGYINIAIYERMLPHATKYGLRMIAMNSRDYHGSTPYTAEELADLASPDLEVQALAVRRWGREVAMFIAYVCGALDISPVFGEGEKKAGGLVLMSWSLSGLAPMGILGDPRTLEGGLEATLAPYLRKVILYDPPMLMYGDDPDIGLYWPARDPAIPPSQKADAFLDWVSSYYAPTPSVALITADALRKCTALARTPTMRTLSPEDLERTVDRHVGPRAMRIARTDLQIRRRLARRAFSDADAVLPDVDVVTLWCDQSVWHTVWGAKVCKELIEEPAEPSKKKRRVSLVKVENANHFLHWDEPERMVSIVAGNCV